MSISFFTKHIGLTILLIFCLTLASCGGDDKPAQDTFDVELTIPSVIEGAANDSYTIPVSNGKVPLETDQIIFMSDKGISLISRITSITSTQVTATLPSSITTGDYTCSIKRDSRKKGIGSTYVNIVEKIDFTPDPSSTVYGAVLCNGVGVPGAVVSDGVEVTASNEKGFYQLKSAKARGYVFISIPSGYEVENDGVLPKNYYMLKSDEKTLERVDFQLTKVNQDNYIMLMFGDMHLANRTNDINQFRDFTNDVTKFINANKTKKVYAMTLGDMTWDLYWYDNNFALPQYLEEINRVDGLTIFHTMGNHDNDMKTYSDMGAEKKYVSTIAPTFYSFNIGKYHYIVLDDIDCSSYDGSTSRNYTKDFTQDQISWLAKDLSYVSKSTPVILTTHAQFFTFSGTSSFVYDGASYRTENTKQVLDLLSGYNLDLVTGHTHVVYNVTPTDDIAQGRDLYEHNSGAVCGSWWWTGKLANINLSTDGTPGGYQIFTVSGNDLKWQFKGTGRDIDYQFRTYDGNQITINAAKFAPNATADAAKVFNDWSSRWGTESSENYVYLNVWNYNRYWTIKVTEDGKELPLTRLNTLDPLHIIAYEAGRADAGVTKYSFPTTYTNHFFRVKASSATSTLNFEVTDQFGNVYKETMTRPKSFSVATYN